MVKFSVALLALPYLLAGVGSLWLMTSMEEIGTYRHRITAIESKDSESKEAYPLPNFPYEHGALEPYIDKVTMEYHHDKQATYVTKLNEATEGQARPSLIDLQTSAIAAGPDIRNNGGGAYNHAFFFQEMSPPNVAEKTKPSEQLSEAIVNSFGSFDNMKNAFEAKTSPEALPFGAGWVWLAVNQKGDALSIVRTRNEDNPLMEGATDEIIIPILGIDVWEHAYYLEYNINRDEYVKNWWNLVNWETVSDNYDYVLQNKAAVPVEDVQYKTDVPDEDIDNTTDVPDKDIQFTTISKEDYVYSLGLFEN